MALRNLKQWSEITKEALKGTFNVVKFFCCLHLTHTYLVIPSMTYGPSMLPTFNVTGDIVLAERLSTRFGKVKTGDIVVTRSPQNPRKILAKRVTGMEGDTVSYVVHEMDSERSETIVVPKGHVWVQGDSLQFSNDSRHFGPVPYGMLQGKIFCRIWPPGRFGSIASKGE